MLPGSILQQLYTNHQHTKRLNLGVYYKNTLVALCHALEDFILHCEDQPILLAAFQRGKWYLEEAQRYYQLAQRSSQVAILATADTGFTEHPTSQLSNVELVLLDGNDPVTQEWHLIILSPHYTAMVLCQELSAADYGAQGWPANDCERKFYGFWTFEPELVKETAALIIHHIESYHPSLAKRLGDSVNSLNHRVLKPENLNTVVSSVVDYLQTCQNQLSPEGNYSAFYQFEELTENLRSNKIQALLRMAQVIDQADLSNPYAAIEVATLSEVMAQLLDLPAWQVKRLRLAALLHRLPLLQGLPAVFDPRRSKTQRDIQEKSLELPKSSLMRVMPQLQAIAQIISHQTEHWDGSGTPAGLAYDQIPLESRILALVSSFQSQTPNRYTTPQDRLSTSLISALEQCQSQSGHQFDPKLVETLTLLVRGMQQGLQIPSLPPKIASGIWLLDEQDTPIPSLNSTY